MKHLREVSNASAIIAKEYNILYHNSADEAVVIKKQEEEPVRQPNLGDILYIDGTKLKTIAASDYTSSLGTALGVCVIPSSHMTPRFISIKGLGGDGSDKVNEYSTEKVETGLHNYDEIPCVGHDDGGAWIPDNVIDHTNTGGYLPSDSTNGAFTAVTNTCDPKTKWAFNDGDCHIPSPFNADESKNTVYAATSYSGGSINNCLNDFNGKSNTATLVGLGAVKYPAANVCSIYAPTTVDGAKQGDWYLPSAGELGYVMARIKEINASIVIANGVKLNEDSSYWSSTQSDADYAYALVTTVGGLQANHDKDENINFVRPFVSVEF